MVVANLFAGESTMKALEEYRNFCRSCNLAVQQKPFTCQMFEKIIQNAKDIVSAIECDGRQKPETQLSHLQQEIAPLLLKSFRAGREIEGMMFPARPTSLQW